MRSFTEQSLYLIKLQVVKNMKCVLVLSIIIFPAHTLQILAGKHRHHVKNDSHGTCINAKFLP